MYIYIHIYVCIDIYLYIYIYRFVPEHFESIARPRSYCRLAASLGVCLACLPECCFRFSGSGCER